MSKYIELSHLINKAKGLRTINSFSDIAGIDAGHLSRIIRGIMSSPPSPEILKKI
jgi:transcriptional regulator with XRE-family HTH domain